MPPSDPRWMIYGATGYTGTLVAKQAVRRGHRPLLAGRSQKKLALLAERLELEYLVVALDDQPGLRRALDGVTLVYHAAGPFVQTAAPMIAACLASGTHYLDITGEVAMLEETFTYDQLARQRGIVLLSGVGFDVVPSDCLALYVAQQMPDAQNLEIAIAMSAPSGSPSAGTVQSALGMLTRHGALARKNGKLHALPLGSGVRKIRFSDKEREVMAVPWGDLATAPRSTGIDNIQTFMAQSRGAALFLRLSAPLLQTLLRVPPILKLAQVVVGLLFKGPGPSQRAEGRSYIRARASDGQGREVQAWLETSEAYRFTAAAGVRSVERVLDSDLSGALTPASAFGADFVLEIEGTRRYDEIAE